MRSWKPQPGRGLWIGLGLLLLALVGWAVLSVRLGAQLLTPPETWPINLGLYGLALLWLALLIVVATLTYRLLAGLTLRYSLDRNGLYINWLGNRAVVPLHQIETVDLGVVAQLPFGVLQGVGYFWGQGRAATGKRLHLFSSQPPGQSLAVSTADAIYLISPIDHQAFVQDLEQRRNLGATQAMASVIEPSRMFLYAYWNDPTVRPLLLVAFAINLLVLALLAARYPALGGEVAMRFNELGDAVAQRPRHQVLFLPLAAFGLTLLNTALGLLLYHRQQLGARLLQGASVVVQLLFGIAVATIVR